MAQFNIHKVDETSHVAEADYVVVNHDFETALEDFLSDTFPQHAGNQRQTQAAAR